MNEVDMSFETGEDGSIMNSKVEYPVPFLRFKEYFSVVLKDGFYKRSMETEANDYVSDGAMDTELFLEDRYNDIVFMDCGAVALFDHESRRYFLFDGESNIVAEAESHCVLKALPEKDREVYSNKGDYFEGIGFTYLGERRGYLLHGGMVITSSDFYYSLEALDRAVDRLERNHVTVNCLYSAFRGEGECADLELFKVKSTYFGYVRFLEHVRSVVMNHIQNGRELTDADRYFAEVVYHNGVGNGFLGEDDEITSDEFIQFLNYAILRSDLTV